MWTQNNEAFDVVVVGGGQAGLSVGYHLARQGVGFVILDGGERIGDAWRKRWDSLRLFSPAKLDGLDGMPFPAPPDTFPTKDEMADYLEAYAARFELPVRTSTHVERLSKKPDGMFLVETNQGVIEARQVVVAMASYQGPRVPPFAGELDPGIVQLHSSEYRNPSQLREGPVLLAGGGNSGAEIAMDVAGTHATWMSGRDTGEIPFAIGGFWGRTILARLLLRGVFHHLLTVRTPLGRRARRAFLGKGGPLIRTKNVHLAAAGVERVPRTVGVSGGKPELEDGRVLEVANVIWCTGFHAGLSWIALPVFDEQGRPRHESGIADEPGLYFVGQDFLHSVSSTMVHGVGRDAERVVRAVVAWARAFREVVAPERASAAALDRPALSSHPSATEHLVSQP